MTTRLMPALMMSRRHMEQEVVIRDTREDYRVVDVDQEWVEQDDSLPKQV